MLFFEQCECLDGFNYRTKLKSEKIINKSQMIKLRNNEMIGDTLLLPVGPDMCCTLSVNSCTDVLRSLTSSAKSSGCVPILPKPL